MREPACLFLCALVISLATGLALECDDGATHVAEEFINDGYCDCTDGWDEPDTSACASLMPLDEEDYGPPPFVCPYEGMARPLHRWAVGDGVCDCCDGADETPPGADPATAVKCKNTCTAYVKAESKRLEAEAAKHTAGVQRYGKLKARASRRLQRANFAARTRAAHAEARKAFGELQRLQQKVRGRPTQRMYEKMQRAHQIGMAAEARFRSSEMLASAGWGEGDGLFSLFSGPCVRAVVGDKQLRGGSTTVIPKRYIFRLCPCRNVTQAELLPDEWKRQENIAKELPPNTDIDLSNPEAGTVAVRADGSVAAGAAFQNRSTGDVHMLGNWIGWSVTDSPEEVLAAPPADTPVNRLLLKFRGGNPCPGVGLRNVTVALACSDDQRLRISDVVEDGMCNYAMTLHTPAACSEQEAQRLRGQVKDLYARQKLQRLKALARF